MDASDAAVTVTPVAVIHHAEFDICPIIDADLYEGADEAHFVCLADIEVGHQLGDRALRREIAAVYFHRLAGMNTLPGPVFFMIKL